MAAISLASMVAESQVGTSAPPGSDDAPTFDPARRFLGTGPEEASVLERLQGAAVEQVRSVGSSSVVFKASLSGGGTAALKLPSRGRAQAAVNEVAAYRLARSLGMDNVPPAASRSLQMADLEPSVVPAKDWHSLRSNILWDAHERVEAASIFWVPGLREADRSTVRRWMQQSEARSENLDSANQRLLADFSTMLAFDYLIGNWDRFSGGNIHTDGQGERLVLRDHDAAFAGRLPRKLHRRVLDRVLRAQRFSLNFVERLRALDADALRAVWAGDAASRSLSERSNDPRFEGVLERRATLLSHVGALIRERGVDQVLVYP